MRGALLLLVNREGGCLGGSLFVHEEVVCAREGVEMMRVGGGFMYFTTTYFRGFRFSHTLLESLEAGSRKQEVLFT